MGTTSNRSYPYPAGSDAVDVPGDIQALADAVDTDVAAVIAGTGLADGSVTDAKLAVPKVDQSVVGNLLTANQATGTDTLGDTTGFTPGSGSILTSSTTTASSGSRSLRGERSGSTGQIRAGAGGEVLSGSIPVQPEIPFTAEVQFADSGDFARNVNLRVYWFQSDGTTSAGTRADSAFVASSSSFQQLRVTAVPPSGAVLASVVLATETADWAVGDYLYSDTWGFWQGAGGLWAPPGTPIANLGTYTDESVGRRIFTWDAVNARWQMTYGDTGWRDVAPENGWTATVLRIRRVGNSCHLAVFGLSGAAATAERFYTLPADFAPPYMVRAAMSASSADTFYTMQVASGSVDVDDAVTAGRMQHSWLTDASWPTSLPGTASGSIPS